MFIFINHISLICVVCFTCLSLICCFYFPFVQFIFGWFSFVFFFKKEFVCLQVFIKVKYTLWALKKRKDKSEHIWAGIRTDETGPDTCSRIKRQKIVIHTLAHAQKVVETSGIWRPIKAVYLFLKAIFIPLRVCVWKEHTLGRYVK